MQIDQKTAFRTELRALRVGMYAAFVMAVVGIGFAYAANSQAILMDGLFNLLLFFMVAIGLSTARKINAGPDERYHFGYGGYEPFLVLVRTGMAIALMAYASFDAVQTIIRGGAEVNGVLALVYSIILAIACGGVTAYMYAAYRKTGWPTMKAEVVTWLLNGVLSSSAGVALFGAGFLRGTKLAWLVPHADSIVVLLMQLLLLPMPLQLLVTSFRELLGRAPAQKLASQAALERIIPADFRIRNTRAVRQGRTEFVQMDLGADPATTVGQCDAIRRRWQTEAGAEFPNTYAILVFSNEP